MTDYNPQLRERKHFETPYPNYLQRLQAFALPADWPVKGIDESHHNTIDSYPAMVAGGYQFSIFKLTEHTTHVDTTYAERYPRMLDAGGYIGGYHFFRDNKSGTDQADHFLSHYMRLVNDADGVIIPPMLDIETDDGAGMLTRVKRAFDWLALVEAETNRVPIVYSSPYMWSLLMGNVSLGHYSGHVAHWTSANAPAIPGGWPGWVLWQFGVAPRYSWCPAVPGVVGDIDVNRYNGTLVEFEQWVGADAPPPPPPNGDHEERITELEENVIALAEVYGQLSKTVQRNTGRIMTIEEKIAQAGEILNGS